MKKTLLTLVLAVSILAIANGQDYKTGIGLRGGPYMGLTVKHFLNEKHAVEGLLQTRYSGFDVTALYEFHNAKAFDVDRLNWYYGFGGHLGSYNNAAYSLGAVVGIDGILGIEYNFSEAPLNIGLDWKPMFNLIGNTNFWGDGGALSIRYIF